MTIRLAPIAAALALTACGSGISASVAGACDHVAARNGSDRNAGTAASPYRSVQRLANALRPGETGCLRAGTYSEQTAGGYALKFFHGGRARAPIEIRSYPGERARLVGPVYVPRNSPHVRLRDLDIDGRATWLRDDSVTVQVMAARVRFVNNDVTNRGLKTCMILGSNSGWGRAVGTVIRGNVFHACGNPSHGLLDHGIYVQNARRVRITDNVFWGNSGYAIQLYPNARRTLVRRNVMAGNGGGVIFAGEGSRASSDNLVERNLIAGSTRHFNIARYWGEAIGTGNVARDNCVYGGADGNIAEPVGFSAVGNVVADPHFADPAAHDYRPRPGTPCTDVVGSGIASVAAARR